MMYFDGKSDKDRCFALWNRGIRFHGVDTQMFSPDRMSDSGGVRGHLLANYSKDICLENGTEEGLTNERTPYI